MVRIGVDDEALTALSDGYDWRYAERRRPGALRRSTRVQQVESEHHCVSTLTFARLVVSRNKAVRRRRLM